MNLAQVAFKSIFSKKGDSESVLSRKNDLALRIAIIFIILAIPYVVIFGYLDMGDILAMVIATIGFLSLSIVCNRVKAYSISKALLVVGPTLTFFGSANNLGPEAGAQLLLFTLVALPLLLFEAKQRVWIVFCMTVPLFAYIALELGHYNWLPQGGTYLDSTTLLYIRCFVIVTTFLLLVLSGGAYFLSNQRYELKLEEKNQELESKNTNLQSAYTRLHTQQTLLKRRIAAIHDMAEQCGSLSEWHHMATVIFRYQLNLPPAKVWLPASPADTTPDIQIPALSEAPAYLPLDHPLAQTILYHTQPLDWESQAVSLILPLTAANNTLIGLIGLALPESLSTEDLHFVALVAKELQRNLQFIHATQTLKHLNIAEALKKNETRLREHNITDRELEIIRLLINGASNATISSTLVISESTTKTHLYNIFKKLSINSRFELLKWVNSQVIGGIV